MGKKEEKRLRNEEGGKKREGERERGTVEQIIGSNGDERLSANESCHCFNGHGSKHCAPVLKRIACIGPKKLGRQQER